MHLRAPALVCATRAHGETGVIVRLLTAEHGLIGGYVAGGRGRDLRPVLIPGNLVSAELTSRHGSQLPTARLELVSSRGPWLTEPLPAAAISWATVLTAATLPERHAYPALYDALSALLDAICAAPSARGWMMGLLSYEALLLRELGYGTPVNRPDSDDWPVLLHTFDRLGTALARNLLAERRSDVMAARDLLRERLSRIEG
jgi:DNA repair protein RecO (recombination protein O)